MLCSVFQRLVVWCNCMVFCNRRGWNNMAALTLSQPREHVFLNKWKHKTHPVLTRNNTVSKHPLASLSCIRTVRSYNFISLHLSHCPHLSLLSTFRINRLWVLSFSPNSRAPPVTSLTGSASLALANFHRLPPDRLSRRALFPHRTLI